MNLPAGFEESMRSLLGKESAAFIHAHRNKARTSVRLHPLKTQNELHLSTAVPWCSHGYYLDERPSFTLDPHFHAGHYYVQEASSMFLDYALKVLGIPKNASAIDLCAAPGGKSTLLASHLGQDGLLHCHETNPLRAQALQHNIIKWGYPNVCITRGNLTNLQLLPHRYDVIIADAPCSGEGMFRKESHAVEQWSPKLIDRCSAIQSHVLHIATQLCKSGGYVFYSTCTYNEKENEAVIRPYVDSGLLESVQVENPFDLVQSASSIKTYRFLPHRVEGEGFSFTALRRTSNELPGSMAGHAKASKYHQTDRKRKMGSGKDPKANALRSFVPFPAELEPWLQSHAALSATVRDGEMVALPQRFVAEVSDIENCSRTIHAGIPIGHYKGKDFFPSQALCQSVCLSDHLPSISMNRECALRYLRCLPVENDQNAARGWNLAQYGKARMGWLKQTGSLLKNYYPIHYRITSF